MAQQNEPGQDIACIGDNCIDRYLPPLNDCLVGGNAVNVAIQLALLGNRVHYFGAVGGDAAGQAVKQALARHGIGLDGLRILSGQRTARTDVEVAADGDRRFLFEDFGACAVYAPSADDLSSIRRMRHVHVGWLNSAGAVRQALAGQGVTVSQDLSVNNSPENLLPAGLDVAFCSAAPEDAEEAMARLIAGGASLAVATLGAWGSMASDGRTKVRAPALPVTPEDTTGAGDAFIAGFIHATLTGLSLEEALALGSARASGACLHRGGFPQTALKGLIDLEEIPRITDL
jgi:fructoselysine 6-kinase